MEWKKKIFFEPLEYTVYIIKTTDVKKSRAKYNEECGGPVDGSTDYFALHSYGTKSRSYIFLPVIANINDKVHECFHAIFRMHNYKGIGLNNESMAYHLGWLVEQLEDWWYTHPDPQKKKKK